MTLTSILVMIVIGGLAGWFASIIMGKNQSMMMNIGVGIIGAFVGSYIFGILGLAVTGIIGSIISATAGAVVLIAAFGFFIK